MEQTIISFIEKKIEHEKYMQTHYLEKLRKLRNEKAKRSEITKCKRSVDDCTLIKLELSILLRQIKEKLEKENV